MELNGICFDRSDLRPEEKSQTDGNFKERRDLRKFHQVEKTKLRRKWKRVKDRVMEMKTELLDKPPGQERNDLIKRISETESSLKRLTEVGSRQQLGLNQAFLPTFGHYRQVDYLIS